MAGADVTVAAATRSGRSDPIGGVLLFARGGTLVEFDVHRIQSVTGMLQLDGGGTPAFGELQLAAPGKSLESPIAADGRFWLDGVPVGTHEVSVEFRGGTCTARIQVPDSAGTLLDVGRLLCTPAGRVAAR